MVPARVIGRPLSLGQRRGLTLALMGALGGVAAHAGLPACPFWQAGIPCPTCGLTRACRALVRGDWAGSFHFNAFWPFFVAGAGLVAFSLLAFGLGLSAAPEAWAQRSLFQVPARWLAFLLLAAELANLCTLGLNPQGWLLRALT